MIHSVEEGAGGGARGLWTETKRLRGRCGDCVLIVLSADRSFLPFLSFRLRSARCGNACPCEKSHKWKLGRNRWRERSSSVQDGRE